VKRWWTALLLLVALLISLPFLLVHILGESDLVGKWKVDAASVDPHFSTVASFDEFELLKGNVFTITAHPGMRVQGVWHLYGTTLNLQSRRLVIDEGNQTIELQSLVVPNGLPNIARRHDLIDTALAAADYDFEVSPDHKTLSSKAIVLHRAG